MTEFSQMPAADLLRGLSALARANRALQENLARPEALIADHAEELIAALEFMQPDLADKPLTAALDELPQMLAKLGELGPYLEEEIAPRVQAVSSLLSGNPGE